MSEVLDTTESRRRHFGQVRYVSPVWGTALTPHSGYLYECPRCGHLTKTMKHRPGAERLADEHALVCRPRAPLSHKPKRNSLEAVAVHGQAALVAGDEAAT